MVTPAVAGKVSKAAKAEEIGDELLWVFGIALGYEDLNDHDQLRLDPLLTVACRHEDPTGQSRIRPEDRGKALAGRNTLNRLELTPPGASAKSRYKKIVARHGKLEGFFVEMFLRQHATPPAEIVLDVDATDDPLHGTQHGRFFHGYYKSYCYLPLYIFCGEHLLCARLRPSNIDAAAGRQVRRGVHGQATRTDRLADSTAVAGHPDPHSRRQRFLPGGDHVLVRSRSIFCWDWRKTNASRRSWAANCRRRRSCSGKAARPRGSLRTSDIAPARAGAESGGSWARPSTRHGPPIGLTKGSNPRFIVTSLSAEEVEARTLYEERYCARGAMENCIKEQQLFLFADRTSAQTMRANQLRVWLSGAAYVLMVALRRNGLRETPLEHAQCDTIRLKLFKIGARVKISVRRGWLSLSSAYPWRSLLRQVLENLRRNLPFFDPRADRPPPVPA